LFSASTFLNNRVSRGFCATAELIYGKLLQWNPSNRIMFFSVVHWHCWLILL